MSEKDVVKKELKDVRKNYTRTPNILFESYPDLRPQEKWLYINLVYLCGSRGTRHLSLRYIHDRTGISLGALSGSKDPAKNDPGMIRSLHNTGLIHAEIKKKTKKDGKESDQAQYHITIVDLWQLNEQFFAERSEYEHLEDESVQNMNSSTLNCSENERERSENERERSENDTNIRLHSNTTEQKEDTGIGSEEHNASISLSDLSLEELQVEIARRQNQQEQPVQPANVTNLPPTPAPEKPARKSLLTPQGQHIKDLWKSKTGRNLAETPANVKALNGLGEVAESDMDFTDVYTMMKNHPFYKQNNVRIDVDFMFRKWDGFIGKVDEFRQEAARKQQEEERKQQEKQASGQTHGASQDDSYLQRVYRPQNKNQKRFSIGGKR